MKHLKEKCLRMLRHFFIIANSDMRQKHCKNTYTELTDN